MADTNPPAEITSREALEILGYTNPSTIARYVAARKLVPARKLPGVNGPYLFHRADVVALAAEQAAARADAARIEARRA